MELGELRNHLYPMAHDILTVVAEKNQLLRNPLSSEMPFIPGTPLLDDADAMRSFVRAPQSPPGAGEAGIN